MDTNKTKWALITGASSGFGRDYAEILAGKGMNLVITARREDRLLELKNQIETKFNNKVEVITADLGNGNGVQNLVSSIDELGIEINTLINNAGFGVFGEFAETDWNKTQNMLMVDIMALTELTKIFVDRMKVQGEGKILLVSSIGAYQPCPTYAAYGAAKAYVLNFGEALHCELKGTGVEVSVLSPGVTETEFLTVAGQKATFYQRILMMKSRPVAQFGLNLLDRHVASAIPGFINNVVVFFSKFLPRKAQAQIAYQLMKN